MILEGIVTTLGPDGAVHVAPMGPAASPDLRRLTLRPFRTSQTYRNLKAHGEGVFHLTDDAELLAHAAVGPVTVETRPASAVRGFILPSACSACEFRVLSADETAERVTLEAEVVRREHLRDFLGWNRGKHAVLEAAILASRVHLLPRAEILARFASLRVLVDKTGGPAEERAFAFLREYVERAPPSAPAPPSSVTVRTGTRLHFGLLAPGPGEARRFGGAGLMVETPGIELRVERAEAFAASGPLSARAAEVARAVTGLDSPPFRIAVAAEAPREHAGLGTGTQLALAVARALAELEGRPRDIRGLCERCGRGRRSGIGAHGFELGGFIADGGKQDRDDGLAPLITRVAAPAAWRWVLALPAEEAGLSGKREETAFAALAAESPAVASGSAAMAKLLLLGLIPALAEGDFAAFSAALSEYGDRAGESFRHSQGGLFASPRAAALVAFARERGAHGAGQSSWGPAVYAPAPDEEEARRLSAAIRERFEGVEVLIARARNQGAAVEAAGGAPSAHTLA